jgi:hypothetical protein
MFVVTPFVFSVLVGLLLGPLRVPALRDGGGNMISRQQQLILYSNLIKALGILVIFFFMFLIYCLPGGGPLLRTAPGGHYCTQYPRLNIRKNDTPLLHFYTMCLPCFHSLYNLFYVNGTKIVPRIIGDIITDVSLAYWSMDDGSKAGSGFYLNTPPRERRTRADLVRLVILTGSNV